MFMQDDDQSQDVATPPPLADSAPAPVEPVSAQPTGSEPANTPPIAPESPINADSNVPVEDQNQGVNQPESNEPEEPISAPNEPEAPVDGQSIPANDNPPDSEPVQVVPVQSVPVSTPTLAPTPPTPTEVQTQPSAQQNQTSFIRALLAKANAKLGSNRQKKLDKVMLLAQKKGFITNEQAQDLLHCSDATATRYLSKLVQQGRLNRTDGSHWVKYTFVR
jgi:hypothetical protein